MLAAELGTRNISVNTLSHSPMATRAASGVTRFDKLMDDAIARSPMPRLATSKTSAPLAGELARSIMGGVLYVDAGRHIMRLLTIGAPRR